LKNALKYPSAITSIENAHLLPPPPLPLVSFSVCKCGGVEGLDDDVASFATASNWK
jgi:hypothetical protein